MAVGWPAIENTGADLAVWRLGRISTKYGYVRWGGIYGQVGPSKSAKPASHWVNKVGVCRFLEAFWWAYILRTANKRWQPSRRARRGSSSRPHQFLRGVLYGCIHGRRRVIGSRRNCAGTLKLQVLENQQAAL